jgi:hypothetical protein
MKPERDTETQVTSPPTHPADPVDTFLAGVRRATEVIDPSPDFAARVLAVTRERSSHPVPSWWAQLGLAGRRVVPLTALAAAAAMALAWSADARLYDSAAGALDLDPAQDLP